MATSKVLAGQFGKGKGYKARAAGLVAATAFGFCILAGLVFSRVGQQAAPMAPAVSAAAPAVGQPADISTMATFRWDFGQEHVGLWPVDASIASEYRWEFGQRHLLLARESATYRVSAPNEHDPESPALGTVLVSALPYRLSPPNELEPAVP